MLDSLKKRQASATMVKHFILMNLIFPLFSSYSGVGYSPNIVYANIFAVMFVALACLEGNIQWKRRNYLGYLLVFCLVGFNVFAFYVNKTYFGWYAGQINVTIAFLFFLIWLLMKEDAACMGEKPVKFLLVAAAVTNAVGLIPGFLGYQGVWVSEAGHDLLSDRRGMGYYAWLYSHKSEYAFFLVLFLSLTVVYRRLFEKKWMFWASIGVYALGLWASGTQATMVAALCIPAGFLMEYLLKKAGGFRMKYLLWFVPVVAVGALLLWKVSQERDIWTLGLRTYIWKAGIQCILDNPWGVGDMCGLQSYYAEGLNFEIQNCHNVFLNYFLQFSIPAGFFYFTMMAAIIFTAVKKNFSFLTLGIWAAILIPMNMDWCVLLPQVPMMLLVMYFLFFHPARADPAENT